MATDFACLMSEAAELGTSIAFANPEPKSHGLALVFTDKWNITLYDTKDFMGQGMRLNWFKNGKEVQTVHYSITNGSRDVDYYENNYQSDSDDDSDHESTTKTFKNGRVFFCVNTDIVEMMVRTIRYPFALNWMYNVFLHGFDGEPMGFTVAVHQIWAFAAAMPLALVDGDHAIKTRVLGFLV